MRVRRTARLILLDDKSRVLLFRVEDASVFRLDEPSLVAYWITPGGALEPGESHASAARREVWEVTGMTGIGPGPWVALSEPLLNWGGELVQAHDRFYLAGINSPVVTLENLSAVERDIYRDHRWWDVQELGAPRKSASSRLVSSTCWPGLSPVTFPRGRFGWRNQLHVIQQFFGEYFQVRDFPADPAFPRFLPFAVQTYSPWRYSSRG
jgi:8-oxo-dGTP pyrophosphatase MutT (NUDIX family)